MFQEKNGAMKMCVGNDFISPEELQKSLQKLDVNIVILQSDNCEDFAKAFKELGANNVIYFEKIKPEPSDHKKKRFKEYKKSKYKTGKHLEQDAINENFLMTSFTNEFILILSKHIMTCNNTFEECMQRASQESKKKQMDCENKIKYVWLYDDNFKEKNDLIKKKINDGIVNEILNPKIPTNIDECAGLTGILSK